MAFVLDSSVTLTWCFEDEATDYADHVLKLLGSTTALSPAIWPLEVANAIRTAERRGRLEPADTARVAELLEALPIRVEAAPLDRALGSILALARAYELTSYDASYLDLAMREGLMLATQDDRLRNAAGHAGILLVE